jgi:hypothetical protein
MLPRLLRLHPSARQRLILPSKEAERDGAYRVAKRLRGGAELRGTSQRGIGEDPAGAAIQGIGVVAA